MYVDPDQWLDEGDLTELPEVHRTEVEEMLGSRVEAPVTSEADIETYLELPIIPEEPETIAAREGINERIQAEIRHEDKEVEAMVVEEMLDAPPAWNKVLALMMETEDSRIISEAATKCKRDEVARGWRKQRREDYIRHEKHEHSPMVSRILFRRGERVTTGG